VTVIEGNGGASAYDGRMRPPPAPAHLGLAGRKLWQSVVREYDLSGNDKLLLEQACDSADRCAVLREEASQVPPVTRGRLGQELPAAPWTELRAERRLLLALLGGLGLTASGVEQAPGPRAGKR
jgi:hypothetical protein